MTVLHWYRRDLRLDENTALAAALREASGQVIPVFILDERLLGSPDTSAARVRFMLDALHVLDTRLRAVGSRLIVRRGDPAIELAALAAEVRATSVYWNRDYTPFAVRRDEHVRQVLHELGIAVHTFRDAVLFEGHEILSGAGAPYSVYTPYWRNWRARLLESPERYARASTPPAFAHVPEPLTSASIEDAATRTRSSDQDFAVGGEIEGQRRLGAFASVEQIGRYAEARDVMGHAGTSRLSPYIRFGCVSIAACVRAALDAMLRAEGEAQQRGAERWLGEIAWRDFYAQIVVHHPHVLTRAYRRELEHVEWQNDPVLFRAWCDGRTGYPVVDAAMRQLRREAWMHNRARMITASFLTKDLLIDWRWGARYFMQQLVDGDPASNNGGWQWAAGTGTDAQPYFRIFNPTNQGQKFDPEGSYVRTYVPELASVSTKYIHAPWQMPIEEQRRVGIRIGSDYPAPIVDHSAARHRALDAYGRARRP